MPACAREVWAVAKAVHDSRVLTTRDGISCNQGVLNSEQFPVSHLLDLDPFSNSTPSFGLVLGFLVKSVLRKQRNHKQSHRLHTTKYLERMVSATGKVQPL